jgi:uncharacterized protein YecT (DUF1311 family)
MRCAAALFCAAVWLSGAASAATDCTAPDGDVAKALCGDPELKAADARLSAAYEAVLPQLGPEQKALLAADQNAWLAARQTDCAPDRAADPAQCLGEATAARLAYLTATPLAGPGPAQPLLPYLLIQPGSAESCEAAIRIYDFGPAPTSDGAKAFNAAIHDGIAALMAGDYAHSDDESERCSVAMTAEITYAAPGLVAVSMPAHFDDGSAHGAFNRHGIVADLTAGKVLAFGDIFPATATGELAAACTADLRRAKLDVYAEQESPDDLAAGIDAELAGHAATIAAQVSDLARWIISPGGAEVYFPPDSIGTNVEGEYRCTLPKALLARLAGVKGWILP